jgi:hypothetical protein
MVSSTPQSLYTRGKSPRYPLDRRLSGVRLQAATGKVFFLFINASRPALTPWVPGARTRSKEAGAWSWPLQSSIKVKNARGCTSTPPYVCTVLCLVMHKMTSWLGTCLSGGTSLSYLYLSPTNCVTSTRPSSNHLTDFDQTLYSRPTANLVEPFWAQFRSLFKGINEL